LVVFIRMTTRCFARACARAAVLLLVIASAGSAQNNATDTETLIKVLQLQPGHVVAEIGAGGGELTAAVARHVGPQGRVFTSELGAERIAKLRSAVEKSGLTQVQIVEGQEAHANLPEACCEAIFMRNVYHHFGDTQAMNASVVRALKPGGRVAVIDFPPRNNADTAPAGKRGDDSAHGVSADVVANELKTAGLTILSSEERPNRWFIVVAQKP
jgi:precorrin-6B methylase 2